MGDALDFLMQWYEDHCDGDWEHQYGVEVTTLDNPGWRLAVDLDGTELSGCELPREEIERNDRDWLHVWSDGSRFEAAGSPRNLEEALVQFRRFVRRRGSAVSR